MGLRLDTVLWRRNGMPSALGCFICGAPVSDPGHVFARSADERNFGVCEAHYERGPVIGWTEDGEPVLLHFGDEN